MTTDTNKIWHESASVIIVTQNQNTPEFQNIEHDYSVLMMKRSERTAWIRNHTVFPGGKLDIDADESIEWLQYFELCGVTQAALRQLLVLGNYERPPILAPQGTGCYDRFFKRSRIWAREISLRLTALRETFEEVGILICRKCEDLGELSLNSLSPTYFEENFDKVYWQKRVHDEPRAFLQLCRSLNVVPDLWALHEWSVWGSPAVFEKCYDTVFFIAFLPMQPNLLAEATEVEDCLWHTPRHLLQLFDIGDIFLITPQYYELSRLLSVYTYDTLCSFARERSAKGSTLYLPVSYQCSDNSVSVLPGDDYYVATPRAVTTPLIFKGTIAEFRARTKRLHRVEGFGTTLKIFLNFKPLNGHLSPHQLDIPLHKL